MTSGSVDSRIILELKKRDYEHALANVQMYLASLSPASDSRDVSVAVNVIIEKLVKDTQDPFFSPFQSGTIFYEHFAFDFSRLTLFSVKSSNLGEIEDGIFRFFNFVYAFRLESVLNGTERDELDIEIFSIPQRKAFPPFAAAQLQIFSATVTAEFSVDNQKEIRQSIRSETEGYKAHLDKLVASIKGWEEKLDSWRTKTFELEKLIKEQHQDLNFVGLSKAFSDLIKKRTTELIKASNSVKLFGLVSIAFPVLVLLIGAKFHSNNFDWSILNYAIPSLTIELLLLYFFRIALRNEYSLKAQLLQLELRYSVCAFIQGYADFAKKARTKDDDKTLDKFEALVFSGITADIQNIPSQFDGVEQLVSLIKGIRGKD